MYKSNTIKTQRGICLDTSKQATDIWPTKLIKLSPTLLNQFNKNVNSKTVSVACASTFQGEHDANYQSNR